VLIADKTIEEQEYERLQRKERSAQLLLGDQLDQPLTRDLMLNELRASTQAFCGVIQ
jgi:hypothetical protein